MRISTLINIGEVVRVRVNPEDVMTCIDIVKNSRYPTQGASLAQIISQALKGFCNFARENNIGGALPRGGFEYADLIAPFIHNRHGVKLTTNKNIKYTEIARASADIPASPIRLGNNDIGTVSVELPDDIVEKLAKCEDILMDLDDKIEAGKSTDSDIVKAKQLRSIVKRLRNGEDVDVSFE